MNPHEDDERYKNLDPRMVETIENEIMEKNCNITWDDIAGLEFAKKTINEIIIWPMLRPDIFKGIRAPPRGIMFFGPPGTGKTLTARAVANRTDACFIRVIGSELVQRYVGEGARMVRELFTLARSKKSCIIFFDEVDAVGGARFGEGDSEVQRTMLEIVN